MPATCDSTETVLNASPVPMACSSTGMGLTTALAAITGTASATGAGAAFSAQPVSRRTAETGRTTVSCSRRFIFRDGWTRRATAGARLLLPAASNFFQISDYTITGKAAGDSLPEPLQFAPPASGQAIRRPGLGPNSAQKKTWVRLPLHFTVRC